MRILIITPTLLENSGWGRYSYKILSEYKKNRIDFIVCTENKSGLIPEERVVLLPFSATSFLKNIIKVKKISKNFDIVHAFDGWPYGIYAFLLCLEQKRNYL